MDTDMKACRCPNLMIISYYTGYIIMAVGVLNLISLIISLLLAEWNPALDFAISFSLTDIVGLLMVLTGYPAHKKKVKIQWRHGFVAAALSWILLMFLCSVPYLLSGHTNSLLDGCFDVMSGFTTTGLSLIQDLDHISVGLNIWRHILTFVGGQGMVVLALTTLLKNTGGAYKFYVGEAKDVELVPNVKGTARMIWKISMIYLLIGTAALWLIGMQIGLRPLNALYQGFCIFASAWSTGGFAPTSMNIMFYHSFLYENVTILFFILGSLNFGLHYAVWNGNRKELTKNIEVQSFIITSFSACAFAVAKLSKSGIYTDAVSLFRRVVYNVLSAHTTTGFNTVYSKQFILQWGDFAILIMIVAMLIGGSACSTAGGFKGLRVGIVCKGILADVKRLISSERNVRSVKYHNMKDSILDDTAIKAATLIIICYVVTFAAGTLLGTYFGYPLTEAAFESASVAGNVGLSIGVTSASMPAAMKVFYIISMYLGRLEFLSVFALIGYFFGGVKKVCQNRFSR